ncbi:hypothetical protein CPB84DRAFT_1846214 [Gymnopilus junonius]|uniref:DUF6534 domain-containing protein n=1 Tax=Gymnopilus junonius TaxID=109634 RepID=A0A9P5NPZ7_GYMJU|nr:hypothetical protein CPB84DRAFT_1846214 [Gymnopilus junonius]
MESPAALPPIPPDIGRVAGPLLLGFLFNWALFGVLSMQVYMYYLAFPNDPEHSKYLVVGVYLFEATQTFLLTQTAFHGFAEGFGNVLFLDEIGTIWFSVPIMSGIVAFVAQTFYAYRISILAQSKIVASFIVLLAVIQLGGSIATGVESKEAVFNSQFLGKKSFITTGIWNGGSALCDIIIAVCMTVYVSHVYFKFDLELKVAFKLSRRNTGMKHTSLLLKKIIRLTIETGSLTAVIALLNFILALLPGHPTYYMTTAGILGKLYSNSMMAVFNSRMKIGADNNTSSHEISSVGPRSRVETTVRNVNAYEMRGGVAITREEVTFPPVENWGNAKVVDPFTKNAEIKYT